MTEQLRTAGLRRRVVAVAMLASLGTTVVLALALSMIVSQRLHAAVDGQLDAAVSAAVQADSAGASPDQLLQQVSSQGVTAELVIGGTSYVGLPSADQPAAVTGVATVSSAVGATPAAAGGEAVTPLGAGSSGSESAPVPVDATTTSATAIRTVNLPELGGRATLSASTLAADRAAGEVVRVGIAVGVVVMLVSGLILMRVVRLTLGPLDRMTAVANRIAAGDRSRRLNPDRTDTELGRAAAAFDGMLDSLQEALHRAERAEQRLREFSDDAAHELRTPVSAVAVTAETLLRDEVRGDEADRLAVTLVRESRRAARILDDLALALSLDTPAEEATAPVLAETHLISVVQDSVERAVLLHGADVRLRTDDDPGMQRTDAARLSQILANLLSNAARHCDGIVDVVVTLDRDTVVVDVQDSGVGIAPADRERVFERLVRLDSDRARSGGGSGLGLSISRGLARSLGGDLVCAEPRPLGPGLRTASGARFALRLPASAPSPGREAPTSEVTSSAAATSAAVGTSAAATSPVTRR